MLTNILPNILRVTKVMFGANEGYKISLQVLFLLHFESYMIDWNDLWSSNPCLTDSGSSFSEFFNKLIQNDNSFMIHESSWVIHWRNQLTRVIGSSILLHYSQCLWFCGYIYLITLNSVSNLSVNITSSLPLAPKWIHLTVALFDSLLDTHVISRKSTVLYIWHVIDIPYWAFI